MSKVSYIQQLWHVINEHHLADRSQYWTYILMMLRLGMISEGMAKAILFGREDEIQDAIDCPSALHRLPRSADKLHASGHPDIELGTLVGSDMRFGLRLDRARHLIVLGKTDTGKTHLLKVMMVRTDARNQSAPDMFICCIVFDRKGGDFVRLARRLGWLVINFDEGTRVALGPPQDFPVRKWNHMLSESFARRAGLIKSESCLALLLNQLTVAINQGRRPGQPLLAPTFSQCLEALERTPASIWGGKEPYVDTLRHELRNVCQAGGDLFEAAAGWDLEDIIAQRRSIVIVMNNMRPAYLRLFLVDLLISRLLYGRMQRCDRRRLPEAFLFVDEGDEDLSFGSESAYATSLSPLSALLKQGRGFGLAAAVGVTHFGNISRFVLSDVSYQFFFNQADPVSREEARAALTLPPESHITLKSLPIGQCIVSEASAGGWPHGMQLQIDPLPEEDGDDRNV